MDIPARQNLHPQHLVSLRFVWLKLPVLVPNMAIPGILKAGELSGALVVDVVIALDNVIQ